MAGSAYSQWESVRTEGEALSLVHVDGSFLLYAVDLFGPPPKTVLTDVILISYDEGQTWHKHQLKRGYKLDGSAWLSGTSYLFTVAYLEDGSEVLMRSENSGLVWEEVMPENITSNWTKIVDHTGDTIVIVTNHGVFASLDAGTSWERVTLEDGLLHRGFVYGIHIVDTTHYKIARSRDFGAKEEVGTLSVELPHPRSGSFFSVDSCLFIVSYIKTLDSLGRPVASTLVHLSNDGGFSWSDLSDQFDANTYVADIKRDNGTLYMLYNAGHDLINRDSLPRLYSSSDGGVTWDVIPTNIPGAYNIFFSNSKIFLSSGYGTYAHDKPVAGASSYSEPLSFDMSIVPNPSTGRIWINFQAPSAGAYSFSIHDVLGKTLMNAQKRFEASGLQSVELDVGTLVQGNYSVSISNGVSRSSRPLIIQR